MVYGLNLTPLISYHAQPPRRTSLFSFLQIYFKSKRKKNILLSKTSLEQDCEKVSKRQPSKVVLRLPLCIIVYLFLVARKLLLLRIQFSDSFNLTFKQVVILTTEAATSVIGCFKLKPFSKSIK